MKPIVLTIMDGVGIASSGKGNAYDQAHKPNIDRLFSKYPYTTLDASGRRVGLPSGQMGNSEVGHMNIGAGRVVYQQLELINVSFEEHKVAEIENYQNLVKFAKHNNNVVHIIGLLSDGGVHSHINHFLGMIKLLHNEGIKIYLHPIFDGRDVAPRSAIQFIEEIEKAIQDFENVNIVTGAGRFYAMDRDSNYNRTQQAYDAIINGKGNKVSDAVSGVEQNYSNDINDEFVVPFVIGDYNGANDGDAFIMMNFRPDRAIQISNAIIDKTFKEFERKQFSNIFYVSMTKYTRVDSHVLFHPLQIDNGLGEFLSNNNYKQLRIAETEKYAHVTFFFDGGEEKTYQGMEKVLINSPKVESYDMQPEMSAVEVCENVLNELDKDYDVVILNFANPDMVGHTGNISATIKAVETVDKCIGKIYDKVQEIGGVMMVTADHGNSECLLDEEGNVVTSHTTNLVPFSITKEGLELKDNMSLCDIAPTILHLLDVEKPEEMTGTTIIKEKK